MGDDLEIFLDRPSPTQAVISWSSVKAATHYDITLYSFGEQVFQSKVTAQQELRVTLPELTKGNRYQVILEAVKGSYFQNIVLSNGSRTFWADFVIEVHAKKQKGSFEIRWTKLQHADSYVVKVSDSRKIIHQDEKHYGVSSLIVTNMEPANKHTITVQAIQFRSCPRMAIAEGYTVFWTPFTLDVIRLSRTSVKVKWAQLKHRQLYNVNVTTNIGIRQQHSVFGSSWNVDNLIAGFTYTVNISPVLSGPHECHPPVQGPVSFRSGQYFYFYNKLYF